jgi:hypothetical protein
MAPLYTPRRVNCFLIASVNLGHFRPDGYARSVTGRRMPTATVDSFVILQCNIRFGLMARDRVVWVPMIIDRSGLPGVHPHIQEIFRETPC